MCPLFAILASTLQSILVAPLTCHNPLPLHTPTPHPRTLHMKVPAQPPSRSDSNPVHCRKCGHCGSCILGILYPTYWQQLFDCISVVCESVHHTVGLWEELVTSSHCNPTPIFYCLVHKQVQQVWDDWIWGPVPALSLSECIIPELNSSNCEC